jgi:predicted O-methyltransferase YrrM
VFSAFEYINYKINSKGRYDIHSPFIYDFVNLCLKIKRDQRLKQSQKTLKSQYQHNFNSINISDAGAGSKKLGSKRVVSQIFKVSSSKGKYANLLYKIANFYKPKHVLEMGTSLGYGTLHLALGCASSNIVTVDACANTQEIAKENLKTLNLENITFVNQTFIDYFNHHDNGPTYDIIFIDGHHDGDALMDYMKIMEKISHDETIFILDDIRWSESMKTAWNMLIKMDKYHVTIDLYRMGILVKRPQQAKEHFVLRY